MPKLRALLAAAICLSCACQGSRQETDAAAPLFARDRVLQIDIDMAPADWRTVRLSHRVADDEMLSKIAEDGVYKYHQADITIDGVKVARVGVRKKGLLGSVVSTRPSLKVKFDEYVDGQKFSGLGGLTLNNNNQDQALVQTFLAYDLFARSGVPAPRANFARVRVNGENLGVYTNVEAIDPPFLRRAFGSGNGVLFESYAGDFAPDSFHRLVEKRGSQDQDRTRPGALRDLLARAGPVSLAEVERLVDLESFMRMWAIESLMGHWDSYSANRNNFYLYTNPATKKLHFIPWGPDSVFADPGPLQPAVVPKSFKAMGLLSRKLWEVPEARDRYRRIMRELLAGPWNESRMVADMAALQKILQPQSTLLPATVRTASESIELFIKHRRAGVEAELADPNLTWPIEAVSLPTPVAMTMTGSFTAPWGASAPVDPFSAGSAQMTLQVGGKTLAKFDQTGGYATTHKQGDATPLAQIRERYQLVNLAARSGSTLWLVSLTIDPFLFESSANKLAIDHYSTWALVTVVENGRPRTRIFGVVGELRLDEAVARAGGTLRGTFTLRGIAP